MADYNSKPPRYQWPADKLSPEDMAVLYHLRAATGTPINHLLREAIYKLEAALKSAAATGKVAQDAPESSPPAAAAPAAGPTADPEK